MNIPLDVDLKLEPILPVILLNARAVGFGGNTGPLVKQRSEMTLILKTHT